MYENRRRSEASSRRLEAVRLGRLGASRATRGDSFAHPPLLRKFDALCHNREASCEREIFHGEQREGSENMSGKRQPTALVEANGRKHLTQAEADQRRDHEVHICRRPTWYPPKWLPKRLRAEYCGSAKCSTVQAYTPNSTATFSGNIFFVANAGSKLTKKAAAAISKNDEKLAKEWTSIQGAYFKQARQCAEAMGLSVTSRCRDRCSDRSCQRGGRSCQRPGRDG